jgi:hypothetical protein
MRRNFKRAKGSLSSELHEIFEFGNIMQGNFQKNNMNDAVSERKYV